MTRYLRRGLQRFKVLGWRDAQPEDDVMEFSDKVSALRFLRNAMSNHFNMRILRDICRKEFCLSSFMRFDDHDVIEQVASLLVSGHLIIAPLSLDIPAWSYEAPVPEEVDEITVTAVPETAWVKFKVIDDSTGEPISGVNLRIALPDGSLKDEKTGSDGIIEVKNISPGICNVSTDLKKAKMSNTLTFLGMGALISKKPLQVGEIDSSVSSWNLAVVKDHKVKTGESLNKIAETNGMTWKELAEFNWDTSHPEEINSRLKYEVGCTKKTADGKNYIFTDNDTPGILLVPTGLKLSGLKTDMTHVIRARPCVVVFDYSFELDGDNVNLSFSIRGAKPSGLRVRLYECVSDINRSERKMMITDDAEKRSGKPGFKKSGRYHEVGPGETLQTIAQEYGYKRVDEIFNHFENKELRDIRPNHGAIEEGDIVYIPQLRSPAPIPLGPLLKVEEVSEDVPDGKRYQARWDIHENSFNVLDFISWQPEREVGIPTLRELTFKPGEETVSVFYLPQFAVLTDQFQVIGVSPTPMWLVHQAQIEGPSETENLRVFFSDGTSKKLQSVEGEEYFDSLDEPITFFGAHLKEDR